MPTCTILAGPNGSGKSTIHGVLGLVGEFVNADDVARTIRPNDVEAAQEQAARLVLLRLRKLVDEGKDFVFETTLSGNQPLGLMARARAANYEVGLVFVALASPELNIRRIAERVARGGHDIPEDVVRRRYPRAFENLGRAVLLSNGVLVYDNSERTPGILLRIRNGSVEETCLNRSHGHHALIGEACAKALNLAVNDICAEPEDPTTSLGWT